MGSVGLGPTGWEPDECIVLCVCVCVCVCVCARALLHVYMPKLRCGYVFGCIC